MGNTESVIKVKTWAVIVGIASLLGFFFIYVLATQSTVDAKQDVVIATTVTELKELNEKKLAVKQYYRDLEGIHQTLKDIRTDIRALSTARVHPQTGPTI